MQPVARVIDLSDMYVRAMVSDHYVGKIEVGQRVNISMTVATSLTSAISRVGRFIEPANRTFEVVVPVPAKLPTSCPMSSPRCTSTTSTWTAPSPCPPASFSKTEQGLRLRVLCHPGGARPSDKPVHTGSWLLPMTASCSLRRAVTAGMPVIDRGCRPSRGRRGRPDPPLNPPFSKATPQRPHPMDSTATQGVRPEHGFDQKPHHRGGLDRHHFDRRHFLLHHRAQGELPRGGRARSLRRHSLTLATAPGTSRSSSPAPLKRSSKASRAST